MDVQLLINPSDIPPLGNHSDTESEEEVDHGRRKRRRTTSPRLGSASTVPPSSGTTLWGSLPNALQEDQTEAGDVESLLDRPASDSEAGSPAKASSSTRRSKASGSQNRSRTNKNTASSSTQTSSLVIEEDDDIKPAIKPEPEDIKPVITEPPPPPAPPQTPADEVTCPICFSVPIAAVFTPCGHLLCGACLFGAVESAANRARMQGYGADASVARCPVCRSVLKNWDGRGGGVYGVELKTFLPPPTKGLR